MSRKGEETIIKLIIVFVYLLQEISTYYVDSATVDSQGCIGSEINKISIGCRFQDSNTSVLECDTLDRARDYAPFVSFPFFVHTKYTFEVLDEKSSFDDNLNSQNSSLVDNTESPIDNELIKCLNLRRITETKLYLNTPWKNVTSTFLEPFYLFLLVGAKSYMSDSYYSSDTPFGYVKLNRSCAEENINLTSCIKGVQAMDLKKPTSQDETPYLSSYWTKLRDIKLGTLQQSHSVMMLELDRNYNLSTHVYLTPLFIGTGLNKLKITGNSWNNMTHLLDDLPSLSFLDLSDNDIQYIDEDNFKSCPNIEVLSLSNNKFDIVPQGIKYLNNLTVLDLSKNPLHLETEDQISNFTRTLEQHKNIISLDLSYIPLKSMHPLHQLLGSEIPKLKLNVLKLSYCQIVYLSDQESKDIFSRQSLLETLDLSGNRILDLATDLFVNLNNLKYLNLAFNDFSKGPKLELTLLHSLEQMNMSHNSLTEPRDIIVKGSIISLDLSYNHISQWNDAEIFQCKGEIHCPNIVTNISNEQLTWVTNVDISHNIITNFSSQMTNSFDYLSSIDLGNNLIDCGTCINLNLKTWLLKAESNESLIIVLNSGEMTDITCTLPLNYTGHPVKNMIFDVSKCNIDLDLDYTIIVAVLGAIVIVFFLIVAIVYVYRFELTYLMHLVKMKRRRNSTELCLSEHYQYDAFVCYSGQDRSWVIGQLLPRLEQGSGKYQLCLHERDFALGSFITHNIISSIQNSKYTIVILSNNFVSSQWCQWELEMANHKLFEDEREFLILIELERLNRNKIPRHLKYLMDTRTYLEWPQDGNEKNCETMWRRLEQTLGASISRKTSVSLVEKEES